ncbi:transcriptional regulator [Kitasatospora phosalacinea]|uniref:Transcriptional regulator n=1 Tax=Kitasatospora phosalacinea TaxID=2065 RepID=A0A9W6QAS4_9ACTN|nr:FMN-binding negative transcriptional regulator [Kitasatospora phosalacinea]GLW71891.1 transcriptional regulator [Kitasatospora phosalacinea]
MLIRGWDRGAEQEWRRWLAAGRDFGTLAANGPDGPVLTPAPFLLDAEAGEVLLHLAAANPLLAAVRADPHVTLAVTDDHAFVPGRWRGAPYTPTSYYASVQFSCTAELVEDPAEKAALLNRQLAHFQPEEPGQPADRVEPRNAYWEQLTAVRGLRLTVRRVRAKFKYDDKKPVELQGEVAERLAERHAATGRPQDAAARAQLLRRMALRTGPADRSSD